LIDRFSEAMNAIQKGQVATYVGIVVNIFLGIVKVIVGAVGYSAALVADGVESLSDVVTSGAVLVGLKLAQKPPDKEHPYGHGRAESLIAKVVAIVIIVVGVTIAWNSIFSLVSTEKFVVPSLMALFVSGGSIVGKEALFQYKVRVARKLGSTSLQADAWHHRSDAFSSIPVFIGIGAAIAGGERWHFMDHAAAVIAAAIIVWVGVSLFRKSWAELMDAAAPEKTLEQLRNIALDVGEVKGVEKIFSRKAGLDIFVDIHIEVAPEKTVLEGHDIAKAVKAAIIEKMPEVRSVLVHIEPYGVAKTPDSESSSASPYDVVWPNFGC